MPEGDTIHRAARTLEKAIGGRRVTAWRSNDPALDRVDDLVGRTVAAVEARGKNLLVRFDDGRTLHTHQRMEGSWHVYRPGEAWRKPARGAVAVIETDAWVAVCFHAPVCDLLAPGRVPRAVRRLGPDLLAPRADLDEALRRMRAHPTMPVGVAVMRQHLVAGIGNVYKSETLFLERASPFTPVAELSDEALRGILRRARRLMKQNLRGFPRTTRRRFGRERLWVYGRAGERCYTCGEAIRMRRQGDDGRSTYFCPRCQSS
ncbi:MAG TPA: DNA-formamidopyrimidine glycosylase family protein [Sandaracinaceae bacterium LLY-WYZ-13_1]|nr:DNA-formamidopyrimidine glycosylase family protein [Sandaracinaceae bacterium LLY-WYZ-13_1]